MDRRCSEDGVGHGLNYSAELKLLSLVHEDVPDVLLFCRDEEIKDRKRLRLPRGTALCLVQPR